MIIADEQSQNGNPGTIACATHSWNIGTNQFCTLYVNGVKVMFGNGETKLVTVGGSQRTSFRTLCRQLQSLTNSTWERIAWIANIQAEVWNYSGPYGYGDMDMLGTSIQFRNWFSRGWKWKPHHPRTANTFQSMGALQKSAPNRNTRTALAESR